MAAQARAGWRHNAQQVRVRSDANALAVVAFDGFSGYSVHRYDLQLCGVQFLPPPRDRRCGAVRCGAVRCGRAIKTIVASGSRPAPETPLKQRAVERTLCSEQSGHAGGWIARGDALICTTDE